MLDTENLGRVPGVGVDLEVWTADDGGHRGGGSEKSVLGDSIRNTASPTGGAVGVGTLQARHNDHLLPGAAVTLA